MKIKKIFIITLFLLSLLMIGAVSAANNDTVVSNDVNDDTNTSIQDNLGEKISSTVLTQGDTKTVSNNDELILKESKEVDITNYTELVNAIKEAENTEYSQYKINLLPGDYNATQSMVWENSTTRNIIINGNNNILDGQGKYQFMNIANSHNLVVENITFTNSKKNVFF